jgi:VWFA-related protein
MHPRMVLLVGLLIALCYAASGRDTNSAQNAPSSTIKSTPTLVTVPTVVRAASGKVITTLKASHFQLTDNGVAQRIFVEPVGTQPIALVVVLQTGGAGLSQLKNYRKLESLLDQMLGTSTRKVALVTFSTQVEQIWAFPSSGDAIHSVLSHPEYIASRVKSSDTDAAITDAVDCAVGLFQRQPENFRRIILLMSQGRDAGSNQHPEDVSRHLAESGATIYSVTFAPDGVRSDEHLWGDRGTAAEFATFSGGEQVRFQDENELERKMSMIGDDIHGAYTLSFYPTSKESGPHAIEVRIIDSHKKNGAASVVLARKRYWIASAPQLSQ